jgi:hypothetical protein
MKQLRYILAGFCLASTLLVSHPSSAQVRELGLGEIVQSANMICIATVTDVKTEVDKNGDVVTVSTFKLEETIAGKPQKTFKIKQIGGEHKGISHKLEHIRYFLKGERVLLTLYPNSSLGFTNPVGLNQGVWTIDVLNQVHGVTPNQLMSVQSHLPKHSLDLNQSKQPIAKSKFVSLIKELHTAQSAKGEVGR